MKKRDLINLIREEYRSILKEGKYKGVFSVEHGSGDSATQWKKYIQHIPGVKASIVHSPYQHHTGIEVIASNRQTVKKIIKIWRSYGIDWPEENDFEPI